MYRFVLQKGDVTKSGVRGGMSLSYGHYYDIDFGDKFQLPPLVDIEMRDEFIRQKAIGVRAPVNSIPMRLFPDERLRGGPNAGA